MASGGGWVRRALSSVRARLLYLVALAVFPAVALTAYSAWELRQAAVHLAQEDAMRLATSVAAAGERQVQDAVLHLEVLSQLPEVQRVDGPACTALFGRQLTRFPMYSNFGAVLPNGDVFCSALPRNGSTNLADRLYISRAIENRSFAIGAYGVGRASNRPFIGVGLPLTDDSGSVSMVVYASLDLGHLNSVVQKSELPAGSTVTVADRFGTILVRHPDPEGWVGKQAPEAPIVRQVTGLARSATLAATDIDGRERLFAVEPIGGTPQPGDLQVIVGIPHDVAFAGVESTVRRNLIGLAVVAGLIFAAAWVGGDAFLLRRLSRLTQAARRMEEGQLTGVEAADLAADAGTDELAQLSQRFGQMAREVLAREDSLRRQVEELRVEIDQAKRSREVSEITGSDYFQNLRSRASELRRTHGRAAREGEASATPAASAGE
jgi:HAMP domain-containing protein